jgi:sarcosine oxidase
MRGYDVIVVGIGAMGSAALHELSSRGYRVLGIDQFPVPNGLGSSHGETRILRVAYFEDSRYVPLALVAAELWRKLERDSKKRLFFSTGSIDAGLPDSKLFSGSLRSCLEHRLHHRVLTSKEVATEFPGYRLPEGFLSVYQPDGGVLLSEKCIRAYVDGAVRRGADIRTNERVLSWEKNGARLVVKSNISEYETERLVVCAGPWLPKLILGLTNVVRIERQVMAWFRPLEEKLFFPDVFPPCNLEIEGAHLYAIPTFSKLGFKCGVSHHLREIIDPDVTSRSCTPDDERLIRRSCERVFPQGLGEAVALKTCIYSNTPDSNFLLDFVSNNTSVIVAGGFSGHGFKFASIVGAIIGDLVELGYSRYDTSMFAMNRFAGNKSSV